jgi:sugar lactone lactonase YvrE
MYIHYVTPYEAIYEYDLSTAWNAGTASYSQKSIPITFPDDVISRSYSGLTRGIRFSNDGTEMFMLGKNTHRIYKFALRTAWDISTLSYTGETAPDYLFRELHNERSPVENNTSGLALNTEDGATFYMRGQQRYTVLQFTGSGTTKTLDLSSGNYFKINTSAGVDIEFSNPPPSGVAYAATIEIESGGEYNIQSAYMSGYIETQEYDGETAANGVTFKPDGTKMYVVGQGQDVAHQYSLSVAWDITSATLETEVSLAASGTVPEAIQFKPDGSIMYILDSNTDSVYQYTLRIPWNVSSSYGTPTSFSVANEETVPCGMWFKTDGTKMFVTGTNGDDLNEYALSTAWDVTSATLTQAVAYPEWGSNIFAGQNPEGVAFSSDGTRVFVLCQNTFIVSFPLSTAWDISTMGNHDRFFDINCNVGIGLGEVMNSCRDIFMSPNGDKFFIVGQRQQNFDGAGQTDGVGAFSLGPTYKVKWPSSIKWEQNAAANPPDVNSKCIYTILTIDGGSTYYGKVSGGHVV